MVGKGIAVLLAAAISLFLLMIAFKDYPGQATAKNSDESASLQLFPVSKGKQYGYMDATGKLVVPCQYNLAYPFYDGVGIAQLGQEHPDGEALVYLNARGEVLYQSKITAFSPKYLRSSEGLSGFCTEQGCGYFNQFGQEVIPPRYFMVMPFSERLGAVFLKPQGKQWGYVDKTGRLVIGPLDQAYRYALDALAFSQGLAPILVEQEGTHQYGFMNASGKIAIAPRFLEVKGFRDGLAPAAVAVPTDAQGHTETRWGYINRTGAWAIRPQFTQANEFSEGLAAVAVENQWGFIQPDGKMVIPTQYRYADRFSQGLAKVRVDEVHYGFINPAGQFVIPPQYTLADRFSQGLVRIGFHDFTQKFGYMNRTGRFVWQPTK